jgi:hypothetical protein
MSPATGPVRGCSGKRFYPTFNIASKMAQRTRRQKECKVAPYHCTHCHGFHVGELS